MYENPKVYLCVLAWKIIWLLVFYTIKVGMGISKNILLIYFSRTCQRWQDFGFFFDHLPPCVDIFYAMNVDKKWTVLDHLPTSSCKRSLWTTPYRKIIEARGCTSNIKISKYTVLYVPSPNFIFLAYYYFLFILSKTPRLLAIIVHTKKTKHILIVVTSNR